MATIGLSKVFILDKYFTELQKFWETERKVQGNVIFSSLPFSLVHISRTDDLLVASARRILELTFIQRLRERGHLGGVARMRLREKTEEEEEEEEVVHGARSGVLFSSPHTRACWTDCLFVVASAAFVSTRFLNNHHCDHHRLRAPPPLSA